jgi:hypothetical protein
MTDRPVLDHASIAEGMKRIPLPRRSRGAQGVARKVAYERAVAEWCHAS